MHGSCSAGKDMDTATESASRLATQVPSHEVEHLEAYLNMICFVSKTPIYELVLPQPDTTENEDETQAGTASGFGHVFPSLSSKSSKTSNADTDISAHRALQGHKIITKSASLLHTEGIVWQSIVKEHTSTTTRFHETFGDLLMKLFPPTTPSLTPLLNMLCQANPDLEFHAIIYHIASMVALQHYIRLTVLRTGQFAPQKIINMQQSYYSTLLFCLYNTNLTATQRQYIQRHVPTW